MPKEDILVEGDYVNELFVIVAGEVQVMRSALEEPAEGLSIGDDGYTSVHSGGAFHGLKCVAGHMTGAGPERCPALLRARGACWSSGCSRPI